MDSARADDTIFALATPAGVSAVAVLRISGRGAGAAIRALTGRPVPPPRRAVRRALHEPDADAAFDDALVLWFPGPASFTGEDMAELQIHGSRAACRVALAVLGRLPGFRLARAGEFARRAFDGGKLALDQVEALADLVAAETEAQARQAMRQLGRGLGARCEAWRLRILGARARAEAEIDFPDEGLPGGLIPQLAPELRALGAELEACLADGGRGERLRDGVAIAVLGPPNAGKSSLVNRLAGYEAAIVAAVAGTTRDVIDVHLDLGGWPVTLSDTAGLRDLVGAKPEGDGQDEIEREGMRRALRRAESADLRLLVLPADDPATAAAALAGPLAALTDRASILLWNKVDHVPGFVPPAHPAGGDSLAVSVARGDGLAAVTRLLESRAATLLETQGGEPALITRARHREALAAAREALNGAAHAAAPELIAEELRRAGDAIGRITGRTGVEDMLDLLFAQFCIGK
jgi:tRNA modification GTPase